MSGSVDGSVIVAGVVYEVPSVNTTTHVRLAVLRFLRTYLPP
jgi:hypothetical protein